MNCVIWGTGNAASSFSINDIYNKLNLNIKCYCDSNSNKQKQLFNGLEVISPENLKQYCEDNKIECILIAVDVYEYILEIKQQIQILNINDIRVITLDMYKEILATDREKLLYYKSFEDVTSDIEFQIFNSVDYEQYLRKWTENLYSEIKFWVNDVAKDGGHFHEDYIRRVNNVMFNGHTMPKKYLFKGSRGLDIGCGLISFNGNVLSNGDKIILDYMDPLAYFYNKINKKYANKEINRVCKFGLFEYCSSFCEKSSYNFIFISNALDHSINPYRSILECLTLLKTDGDLHLIHARREGLNESYSGLHSWNFDFNANNEFIIWNQKNMINITNMLSDIASVHVIYNNRQIIVDIVKNKDFDLKDYIDILDDRDNIALTMDMLCSQFVNFDLKEKFESLLV